MKKIAVFSDIHIPTRMESFPLNFVLNAVHDVDYVIGLGDYINQEALDFLYSLNKQVYAVYGNMDDAFLKETLPHRIVFKVDGVTIGITHGWGAPVGIRDRIYQMFVNNNDLPDLICYGHTHRSYYGNIRDTMFFNPGSLSENPGTFGILKINGSIIDHDVVIVV